MEAGNPPLPIHAEWKPESWINSQSVAGGHDVTDRAAALIGESASKADLLAFLRALSGASFDSDAYVWRDDDFEYALIEDWRNTPN